MPEFTEEQQAQIQRVVRDYYQRCDDMWGEMLEEYAMTYGLDPEDVIYYAERNC